MKPSSTQQSIKELTLKLNQETAKIEWQELQLAFAQGHIVVVEKGVDLVDVAVALSLDEKQQVSELLDSKHILRPDISWVRQNCSAKTMFWAVVVKPFVVIQSA